MSGIVGIVHGDGAPLDRALLHRLTGALTFRGPDRQAVWCTESAGFGHTLLHTTETHDVGPAALSDRLVITADARVDDRAHLVRTLEARGRADLHAASDAQLILHAYDTWGPDCVDHILGDFSFAIWDAGRRRLFCARDRFAIKPFYFSRRADTLIFSNTLDCLRLHPDVGQRLNEPALGDFLLFGDNEDWATTTFVDIQRLPPAHTLIFEPGVFRISRYWTVPTDSAIRYARPAEYVEHFSELLSAAIADRIRTAPVGVWMSGGLDSSSVAAVACARAVDAGHDPSQSVRGQTVIYDSLFHDGTRSYAASVSGALGINTTFFAADDHAAFDRWDEPPQWTCEPTDDPFVRMRRLQLRRGAMESRVWLSGEGADEVFWPSTVLDLIGSMPLADLAADVGRTVTGCRRRPGLGFRRRLERWRDVGNHVPAFPAWINESFARRCNLLARWHDVHDRGVARSHSSHAEAAHRLATAPWPWYFETFDAGATGVATEARYPFLDLRLVTYVLSVPPMPWCVDKELLRRAMDATLPKHVARGAKRPLGGDPLAARLRAGDAESLDADFRRVPELDEYVKREALPRLAHLGSREDAWRQVRPLCLNRWLEHYRVTERLHMMGATPADVSHTRRPSECRSDVNGL